MSNLAAVLTGDLIGSTEAGPSYVEQSMTILAQAAETIGREPKTQSTRFSRHRGDGWQMYLDHASNSLWVAVYLNALLKAEPQSLPTRIAIGIGKVDSLGATGLAAASGTAFTYSGRALDSMVRVDQILTLAGEATDEIQRSLLAFVDERISRWSREQAEVVKLKLTPRTLFTQGEIATRLGITRQAVAARLQAAGFDLIWNACNAVCHHPAFQPSP